MGSADYANRVFCLNSGYNLGLSREDAIIWRALIDEITSAQGLHTNCLPAWTLMPRREWSRLGRRR